MGSNTVRGAAAIAAVALASSAMAYTVNSGYDSGAAQYAEAKARGFGQLGGTSGYELSMARDNSGGGSFVPANSTYDFYQHPVTGYSKYKSGANAFTLTYNAVDKTLDFQVNGQQTFNVPQLSMNPAEAINYLQFSVVDRRSDADARVTGLTLNGDLLGDFGSEGWNTWYIADFGLAGGFTLTGNLVLSGTANFSQETSKFMVILGNSDLAAPIPLPSAAGLAGVGLIATGARRRRTIA